MDINFHIGLPILLANQGFRIEYRKQGDTIWILYGIEDNDVTITGLDPDTCYEIQITFLQSISPLIECPSVIEVNCLDEEVNCITFTAEFNPDSNIPLIDIDINFPSPLIVPCGGYNLYYGEVTSPFNLTQVHYATLPSSIQIPVSNNSNYYVSIYAVDCEGNETLCDEVDVPPLEIECTPAVISNVTLNYSGGLFTITITLIPSNPASPVYYVNYHQSNQVFSGVNDPGGTIPFNSTNSNPEIFTINANPNFNVSGGRITYVGGVTDNCGHTSYFDKTLVV